MKTDLKEQILNRIKNRKLSAFSCYDFTDLASYKAISKCLERLEDLKEITRIIHGIYCLSRYDETLKLPILPSVDDIIRCLAKKNQWTICPAGEIALNAMGLSTQVPATYSYLTSGPYKKYLIYGTPVSLKRTMTRELGHYSSKTLLLIQCLKNLGKDNITEEDLKMLRNKLSEYDRQKAIKETTAVTSWIRKDILKICQE